MSHKLLNDLTELNELIRIATMKLNGFVTRKFPIMPDPEFIAVCGVLWIKTEHSYSTIASHLRRPDGVTVHALMNA